MLQIPLFKPVAIKPTCLFDLYVTVDYGDVFRTNIVLETLLLGPLIIAVLSTILILYIRQRMIQPMKRLTQRLSQLDAASTKLDVIEDQGILEIDQANHKLNQVLIHMKDLQIRAYHAQLNPQKKSNSITSKIKFDPIFYLNMLSMIHSMLQTKDYKEIEELTKVTSNYLRHLFQANQDFNRLVDEIQHIRNYLEIKKIRYGDSIHFDLDWDPHLKDAAIPLCFYKPLWKMPSNTAFLSKIPSTFSFPFMKKQTNILPFLFRIMVLVLAPLSYKI